LYSPFLREKPSSWVEASELTQAMNDVFDIGPKLLLLSLLVVKSIEARSPAEKLCPTR
jgi:hypothetical protein